MNFKYIDLKFLLPIYEDQPQRLKEITLKHVENADTLLEDLNTAISQNKKELQKKSAHSLKSAFRFLGLEDLALTAQQMENQTEKLSETYRTLSLAWLPAKKEAENFCNS